MNSVLAASRSALQVPLPADLPTLRPLEGMWLPGFVLGQARVYFDRNGPSAWWTDLRREAEADEGQDLDTGLALLPGDGDLHALEVLHVGTAALRVALAAWLGGPPIAIWPDGAPPLLLPHYLADLDH